MKFRYYIGPGLATMSIGLMHPNNGVIDAWLKEGEWRRVTIVRYYLTRWLARLWFGPPIGRVSIKWGPGGIEAARERRG